MNKKLAIALLTIAVGLLIAYRALTSAWQDSWQHLNGGDNSLVILVIDESGIPIRNVVFQFSGTAHIPKYPFPFSSEIQRRKDFEVKTDKAGMTWLRWPKMILGLQHAYVGGKEVKLAGSYPNWTESWAGYAESFFVVCRYSEKEGLTIIRPEENFMGNKPFKI